MDIIIWIVIIIVYVKIKAKKKVGNNTTKPSQPNVPRKTQPRPNPVRNTYARPVQKSFAAMPKQESGKPNVERNCAAEDGHRNENKLFGGDEPRTSAIPNTHVTRTYIEPKKSGNRKTAQQLYMGDPVPKGMRKVKCGYCAADNLVPFGRNEYKCYFCHYDI